MRLFARAALAAALSLGLAFAHVPSGALAQDAPAKSKKGGGGGGGGPSKHKGGGGGGGHHGGGGNKAGKIAGGIAAGIAGAIILNEIAKSQRPEREYRGERYYGGDGRLSCRQLSRRCDDGQGWACRKFDREC